MCIRDRPYSGTQVIRDYGEKHLRTGDLIVYTSADSVLQIAAHEEKIPLEELYHICETARKIMQGEHGVGRIIARPFIGNSPDTFVRTANRRDFSLVPPQDTLLDYLMKANLETIGVEMCIRDRSPTTTAEDGPLALGQAFGVPVPKSTKYVFIFCSYSSVSGSRCTRFQ